MSNQFKVYNQKQYRPFMTYIFLGINVAVYVFMLLKYNSTTDIMALLEMGANFSPAVIIFNEWWRLVTAAFIHIGFSHILMNGISLYFLGMDLEKIHGHGKFALIYLISAIGGNLFSFAFNVNVSAGASTAIFGMFASYLVLAYLNPDSPIFKQRASTFTVLLVLNFLNGLFTSGIDNWGHLGGAIFGALITFAVGFGSKRTLTKTKRLLAVLAMLVIALILVFIGRIRILS